MSDFNEARKRIVGKTWLIIQLMQGAVLTCHHSSKRHYALINGRAVTETHPNEAGLVSELAEYHDTSFRNMDCLSSEGDMDLLITEWRLKK